MTYSLSIEELRSFLVRYHSLDNYDQLSGRTGNQTSPSSQIKKLLRRLGSVQYDPLNVVGRNPDLVFQSRIKGYTMGLLDELLYKERSLIDGWDKEMSIYLIADWPYFNRIRQCRKKSAGKTLERRGQGEVFSYLPRIIEEIKNRGPLSARDIKLGATQKNRWGHRQVSGAALDYLNAAGKLGIKSKKNAQKVYDSIENLVPEKLLKAPEVFTCEDDFLEWYFLRRIGSIGAYWFRNGPGWLGYYLSDSNLRRKTLKSLEEKKLIVPIKVPEINETFYMRRKDVPILNEKDKFDNTARFLAPLDNMLWDRLLLQKVFNFQYTWEVYVPEDRRKFGYYVLPVLYQNNLIARVEPVKHEKGRPFSIKNWWWEPAYSKFGTKERREIKEAVAKGLDNFAAYLGSDGVDKLHE